MRGFMNPFDDIFHNFQFRGGLEANCNITFMEAAKGVTKTIEVLEVDLRGQKQIRQVNVPIPAGVADGQTLRMSLGGAQEVFITVRVATSDYFRREEYDVHTTAYISLSQALLGGVIRIAGLHGDINLRIPQGTSSHTEMTLSGRGIKHMESYNTHGDHVVHIMIKMPASMTEEQLEIIREYAYLEKNTPGTINGVDKSSFRDFRMRKPQQEEQKQRDQEQSQKKEEETVDQTSSDKFSPNNEEKSTDAKGTLAKIIEAINENETVKMVKKKLWG